MLPFTKEVVEDVLTKDFKERLSNLRFFIGTENKYIKDMAEKAWNLITMQNNGPAYSLFKNLGCHNADIESLENLGSFLSNLIDDAYFAIEYDTDGSLYQLNCDTERAKKSIGIDVSKPCIHTSGFSIVWCDDNHYNIIREKDLHDILDWNIKYAKDEYKYDKNGQCTGHGPTGYLSMIDDNWEEFPKSYKIAYDHYALEIGRMEYGVFN